MEGQMTNAENAATRADHKWFTDHPDVWQYVRHMIAGEFEDTYFPNEERSHWETLVSVMTKDRKVLSQIPIFVYDRPNFQLPISTGTPNGMPIYILHPLLKKQFKEFFTTSPIENCAEWLVTAYSKKLKLKYIPTFDEDRGEDLIFKCPRCDYSYLHHKGVTDHGAQVAIEFQCEKCGGGLTLNLVQHKCETFLSWNVTESEK
jgi:hypothetical protein